MLSFHAAFEAGAHTGDADSDDAVFGGLLAAVRDA
jgi:hypothetical protein